MRAPALLPRSLRAAPRSWAELDAARAHAREITRRLVGEAVPRGPITADPALSAGVLVVRHDGPRVLWRLNVPGEADVDLSAVSVADAVAIIMRHCDPGFRKLLRKLIRIAALTPLQCSARVSSAYGLAIFEPFAFLRIAKRQDAYRLELGPSCWADVTTWPEREVAQRIAVRLRA